MLRGIKGNSPVNVTKYIKFLFEYIGDHNIIKKVRELEHCTYFDEEKGNKLDQIIRRTPASRAGKVSDITGLINFLLKKEAAFISGQTILVDGGLSS